MQRLTWVVLLLGVGVARAQVGTNVLQRLFLPVISYRLASTATLLEDDLDRMLDPSMAGTVQGARVYTNLSDLFQGEHLFGNVGLHAYTLAGIGGSLLNGTPLGLVDKSKNLVPLPTSRPGVRGRYTLDSLHYFSTQGAGFPPDRKERIRIDETSETRDEQRFLLAGLAFERWGLDVLAGHQRMETRPFGTEIAPFGNVSFLNELTDHPQGNLLYRRQLDGERLQIQSQELWGMAGGFRLLASLPLSLTVGLVQVTRIDEDTASYTGLEDLAPGGTLNQVLRQGTRRQEIRWPDRVFFGELRYDLAFRNGARATVRAGLYQRGSSLDQGTFLLDTLRDARALLVDTAIQRLAFHAETTMTGQRATLGTYLTWAQQHRYDRARFALGASFWAERAEETVEKTYTERTVERITDGNGVPADPNDITRTTTYSEQRRLYTLDQRWGMDLPVAVEFQPYHQAPLWVRLGAWFTMTWEDRTVDDEGLENTPRTIQTVTDAGDTTWTRTPVDLHSVRTRQHNIQSSLQFVYGATVPIGKHLRLDVMQFARLTDLTGWRVSVVWKP